MKIKFIIASIIIITIVNCSFAQNNSNNKATYQCIPCGYDCDKATYQQAGVCKSCNMELVKTKSITFKTIQPNDVCNYIKSHPNVVLLDVRTKEEFAGKANPNFGTLKNAINIPVQELESKIASLQSIKNKAIIVYCSHSHRSPRASYLLTQNGFTNVTNMAGGMSVFPSKECMK
ncbi:MAG: rhodanese-like domain-containing protein [Sphingobacteriia bacterium]|jgi:rhodanese-related sulfurtransferase/DNA-directed RNA polymerase subunit RPC12/RpoP